jgi:hypothetical protein
MAGQNLRGLTVANELKLWQPESGELLPRGVNTPVEITSYAQQLSKKDKTQISAAFDGRFYEMGMSFLWSRTIAALKNELANVGVSLVGEMLGKLDVEEDDDIDDILTTKESIRLAEELGVVSSTDAMRLRHTNEIISHFSQLSTSENDSEEIDESEAIASLKACVKAVLGKPQVEVAAKFIEFRDALDSKSLSKDDPLVGMLSASPYFFQKLAITILVNAVKKGTGAQLEISLANINVLLPSVWSNLRDTERWHVGHTYAELYSDGKSTAVSGVKSALSKVKGFDYVPENLRSATFLKAAAAIVEAHEGMNNFYNELSPLRGLSKLGTTIPTPALGECISAILCARLGNEYGVANNAQVLAKELLDGMTPERWEYYLNQVLPGDVRILNKLGHHKPMTRWIDLVNNYEFNELDIKNKEVKEMVGAIMSRKENRIKSARLNLLYKYYGKK